MYGSLRGSLSAARGASAASGGFRVRVEGFEFRVKVFYVVVPVSGAKDLTKDKGPRRPEKTSISVLGSYSKTASSMRDGPCKELLS